MRHVDSKNYTMFTPWTIAPFYRWPVKMQTKKDIFFLHSYSMGQKAEASLDQITANPPIITALLNKLSLPAYPGEKGLKLMKCGRCFEVYLRA